MTETDDINAWTLIDGTEFTPNEDHELKTTSAGLFGILKESKTKDENVAAAQTKVYANLYLAIDRSGEGDVNAAEYFLADIDNQNAEAGTSFSLLEVMEAINKTENWSRYSDTQKANVKAALLKWAGWVTDAAATEWQSKFNNILA